MWNVHFFADDVVILIIDRVVIAKRLAPPLLLLAGLAALLLVPLPAGWRGLWQSKVFDFGHVPLFAAVTVALWHMLGRVTWSIATGIAVAMLAEALQAFVGRSADLGDLLRGALGVGAGAAGISAWRTRWDARRLAGWLFVILLTLAWPLYDSVPYFVDAYEGGRDFPVLAHFQTERELLRWRWRQADVTRIVHGDGPAARIVFHPGAEPYPYAALRPIRRDFTGYRELCASVAVRGDPFELVISLRSGSGEEGETTHYQQAYRLTPGHHILRVNLAAAAPRADPRPLDLGDVWIVQFFIERPQQARSIDLHRVWLE